jgi:hypothetical protein
MKNRETDLDRLLRSAAGAPSEPASEIPFGFETRVVALSRKGNGRSNEIAELSLLLRRTGLVALVVLIAAGTGVYRQLKENEAQIAPQTNEYAIADSAIQSEFQP